MKGSSLEHGVQAVSAPSIRSSHRSATACALAVLFGCFPLVAQVITIDSSGKAVSGPEQAGTVDRRFSQIQPTQVPLPQSELDPKARIELLRFLESDQGFAMRPFPRGHRGLTLVANGKLDPAGEVLPLHGDRQWPLGKARRPRRHHRRQNRSFQNHLSAEWRPRRQAPLSPPYLKSARALRWARSPRKATNRIRPAHA